MMTAEIINEKDFQIFKIPNDFKINDSKVYLKKIGNSLYLIPFHNPWQSFFDSLDKFSDDFMNERQQAEQKRELFD
jgi:antitoxin VapB